MTGTGFVVLFHLFSCVSPDLANFGRGLLCIVVIFYIL